MIARCHCCGGTPDTYDTTPRYCHVCRSGCKLVAVATILRGPTCPFLKGKTPPVIPLPQYGPPLTKEEPVRTGVVATGTMYSDGSFEWRGRRRRNVPGG